MPSRWSLWLIYVIAFVPAFGMAWFVMSLMAGLLFGPGADRPSMLSVVGLPILAGLCVFALIFSFAARCPLKLKFWLGGLALCGAVVALSGLAIFYGYVTPGEAGILAIGIVFFAGRYLVGRLTHGVAR